MFNNLIRKFYADNVELNIGSGGKTIATDDIGGIQHELVKVEFGTDGNATMVSSGNPLPVTDNAAEISLASIDAKLTNPLPVSGTVSAVVAGTVAVSNFPATQPVSGTFFQATQPVSGPLTDVQLRATPVPISGTVAVTGAGDATAANQTTQITAEQAIQAAVQIMDDWDESDRAKVNPIVGQAGVDAGSGATTAKTQRVILATDQPAIPVTVGATDNTTLYSNTLAVTGAITGIETTGYQNIIFSFSGVWAGILLVEGSEDNSIWEQKIVLDVNEFAMQDIINENGIFQIKSSSKYVRINVFQVTGTITALIVGRTVPGLNAADSIAFAMDKSFNMPLYVSEVDSKKDIRNALIPSDAPAPIYGFAQATNAVIFQVDTTGYQSVVVQGVTIGSTITIQTSNDGVTWGILNGYTTGTTNPTSSITAAAMHMFPAIGRFVRGLMGGANFTSVFVYLRQQPIAPSILTQGLSMNLQSVGGTTVVTGGVSGIQAIGGNIANGVAPTANPILIAGIDNTAGAGLTRRILVDTAGRIIGAGTDQTATSRPIGVLSPAASILNVASLTVQDTSLFEGQTFMDLLAQILLELRINNQMMAELPLVLQGQNGKFDEPSQFRQDQSLFAI